MSHAAVPPTPAHAEAPAAKVIELQPQPGDNAPAVRQALAELAESPTGGTLKLAPGRYLLRAAPVLPDQPNNQLHVLARNLRHVTIEGTGATIVGSDPFLLLCFHECHHLTIRGLTIDWNQPSHSAGRVVAVNEAEHAIDIEPRDALSHQPGRIVQAILAYDPVRNCLADSGWEVYQTQGERDDRPTQTLPDGKIRLYQKKGTPLPKVGWHVIARHQVYGHNALTIFSCSNVLLENVTVHDAPGMGLVGANSTNITLRKFTVEPRPGQWMSVTADGTHFNGCRGTVTVEDSTFVGMGDDAINIHGMYGKFTQRLDDRTLAVNEARMHPYYDDPRKPRRWHVPEAGDVLEFGSGDQPLLAMGTVIVERAEQDPQQSRTIITLREPIPAELAENALLANVTASPAVRIRNCVVRGNRARGFLMQARDVLIERCRFEDVSGAAIQICADAAEWCESLGTRDITVRDSLFKRCNFGVAKRTAALDIFADNPGHQPAAPGVHQRLTMENNRFEGSAGSAIHIGSAQHVIVTGNRIDQGNPSAIVITSSQDVRITHNTCHPGPRKIELRGKTDRATIHMDGNIGLIE